MWALWIWLIIPAPISAELRRQIVETSLRPTLNVLEVLVLLYLAAVISGRSGFKSCSKTGSTPLNRSAGKPAMELE
jgi:hypothetical protein